MQVEYEQTSRPYNTPPLPEQKQSFLTNFVIKHKLAKDYKGAQTILLVIALIFFALSLFFFFK